MAKPTNESRIKALEERVTALELKKVEEKVEIKRPEPVNAVVETQHTYPIPSDYREIVDFALNKSFGLSVVPQSDSPQFQLTIIVPEKYSSLGAEARAMLGGYDIRSKVISYADGKNGVKQYVDLVKSSFSPETRALIEADKHA